MREAKALASLRRFTYMRIIPFAQMSLINANADVSSEARDLNFDLSFHLHPYFVYASSEDSGEPAHIHIHANYHICATVSNKCQC